jgi:protein ImuB
VHGLALRADHRPEVAWQATEVEREVNRRAAQLEALAAPRPLWLFDAPRPLQDREGVPQHDGALELLAGPERIESGWWDGREVRRDYFVARAPNAALLWVFRESGGGWYLHGVFS